MANWDNYSPYVPPHRGPLEEMSRAEARECFDHLLYSLDDRRAELIKLLSDSHDELDLGTRAGLEVLDKWYRSNVEPSEVDRGRMRNLLYSVSNDIGLVMGDALLTWCPGLSWHFFTGGRKNVHYQHAVIVGFTVPENKKYNFDPIRSVVAYGTRLVQGFSNDPGFLEMLDRKVALA